jgi:hypothetical protein
MPLGLFSSPAAAERGDLDSPDAWLATTRQIDHQHPEVFATARRLTAGIDEPRERAKRIHDFVRDEIRFGWSGDFFKPKASEVLSARRGYCTPKATLFIALLRAAGIPARQQFCDIPAGILRGFTSPGAWVDHSYTEVWLGGRWIALDSYVIDRALHATAVKTLQVEGRDHGYGVHLAGSVEWDGAGDAFVQFTPAMRTGARLHGAKADSADFFATADARFPPTLFNRVVIPLALGGTTKKVDRFRDSTARK